MFDHFDALDPNVWTKANWASSARKMSAINTGLGYSSLRLTCPANLDGGGVFTNKAFGYGKYMSRFKTQSVVSGGAASCHAFYMYQRGVGSYADEIDIEIYSGTGYTANTNYVSFVIWRNGGRVAYNILSLGFDSSLDSHIHGFDWQPDKIVFLVDNVVVWTYVPSTPDAIPKNPMSVCLAHYNNLWHGDYVQPTVMEADYVDLVESVPTPIPSRLLLLGSFIMGGTLIYLGLRKS